MIYRAVIKIDGHNS